MASKKSGVWKFFDKVVVGDVTKTKCMLCQTVLAYSGGGTSTMKNHLKNRHKKSNLDDDSNKPTQRQMTLHAFNQKKTEMSSAKYNAVTRSLALACALDLRPISLVMGKGFRNFCKQLNPGYQVPCRATITSHLIKLYTDCKDDIIDLLSGCTVSLTTDLWTSIGTKSYITLTGHFIKDWQLYCKILATRPLEARHTGAHIAEKVLELKDEFKIERVGALVTDNAANMLLATAEANLMHWPCYSHTLQLAIEDSLKTAAITKALAFGRKLVGHFSHSTTASAALKARQKSEGVQRPLSLIQSVPTRWNSQFFMAERLLKLRLPVFAVLWDKNITSTSVRQQLDLPDSSWKILEDIVPVLEPCAEATEILTKEDTPTLSQVYMLLHQLVGVSLARSDDDSSTASSLKAALRKNLCQRFKLSASAVPQKKTSPAMVATFLDPRYKSLKMLNQDDRNSLLTYVQGLVPDEPNQSGGAAAEPVQVKQEDTPVKKRIFDCLEGDIEIDLTTPAAIQEECEQYLMEPVRIRDPLQWWKANENR